MNPDVSCFYGRVYPTRDCMINVVITTKHLKTQKNGNSHNADDVTLSVIIRKNIRRYYQGLKGKTAENDDQFRFLGNFPPTPPLTQR